MTELRAGLPIVSFSDQIALEGWFAAQPSDSNGAWIRFRKKGSSVASVTKAQAIDSALCYGWIDGQFDKYDADSWLVRFTPRRPHSKWSEVNRKRALELISAGSMQTSGQLEIDKAKADGSLRMRQLARPRFHWIYRMRSMRTRRPQLSLLHSPALTDTRSCIGLARLRKLRPGRGRSMASLECSYAERPFTAETTDFGFALTLSVCSILT
ncbi:YdeI/OmpD-associated family protein [Mesorhizobium sp. A623]